MTDHDAFEDHLGAAPAHFQKELEGLLTGLAARDPERAASSLGAYLDDLAAEADAAAPTAN